ncbi:L-tyrosine/L-tryptophan isonitrile synthase family protein [Pseudomonas lini]
MGQHGRPVPTGPKCRFGSRQPDQAGPSALEKNLGDLIEQSREDESLSQAHDHLCSHLYNDLRLCREDGQSEDEYLQQINFKAYQMMYRGQALNAAVDRFFGDDIRLSVHQYSNAGPKFTFGLAEGLTRVYSPWHAVPVCNLDGSQILRTRAQVDLDHHVLVTYEGRPWLYHQTENPQAKGFEYELQKNFRCLAWWCETRWGWVSNDCPRACWRHWWKPSVSSASRTVASTTRTVLLAAANASARCTNGPSAPCTWSNPRTNPKAWCTRWRKTPLHWDLNMLPDSDAQVQRNPKFCASKFMLYCKTAPQPGEGQTTVVDSRNVLRKVGQQVARQWQDVNITYYTKMTYFGGSPRMYSLVDHHPPQRRTHPALSRGH